MADLYDYWRNGLQGKFGPVHDGDPQCGFYRWRNKGGHDLPVAIWQQDGAMLALLGLNRVDPINVWISVCSKPIPEEVYRGVLAGGMWPDEIAPIGSNNPPGDEAAVDEIQSAVDAALAELKNPVTDQAGVDRLANHRDRLTKLWKAQEDARKTEKQPHMDSAKAVDDRYGPILDKIKAAGEKLKAAITAWMLTEEQRRRQEALAQMKAEEEARAAAAARNEPPPPPAPIPVIERPKAGTTGRTTALRTTKKAVIADYEKALAHFKDSAEVKEAVQLLANKAARAGIAVPGVEVHEERSAA